MKRQFVILPTDLRMLKTVLLKQREPYPNYRRRLTDSKMNFLQRRRNIRQLVTNLIQHLRNWLAIKNTFLSSLHNKPINLGCLKIVTEISFVVYLNLKASYYSACLFLSACKMRIVTDQIVKKCKNNYNTNSTTCLHLISFVQSIDNL